MRKQSTILILSATLAISNNVNASKIISPVSVIDAPPHLISGFSYDRTIDQSGLDINFVSGTTDFDTFIGNNPTHSGSGLAQTYAASSHLPNPFLNVDYDLGSTHTVEQLAFWNYPFDNSAGITEFSIYTSNQSGFLTSFFAGSFTPLSDGSTATRSNDVQVFDLIDSNARYLRFQITGVESTTGNGFSEIAFDAISVPIPAAFWLFLTGLTGIFGLRKRSNI